MPEVTKTYVEFMYPGALFAETEDKEVKDRDVESPEDPAERSVLLSVL